MTSVLNFSSSIWPNLATCTSLDQLLLSGPHFNHSKLVKLKSKCAAVLPIHDFLLAFNGDICINCTPLLIVRYNIHVGFYVFRFGA